MTDRVPGAPGQYQALITAEALEKMRSGEAFPIILTRDDQPIVPGTPYSKAAVLPDALAQRLCPGNPDPTPADALAALLPATHGDDRNNPHGVTPAQIGALSNNSWATDYATVLEAAIAMPKTGGSFFAATSSTIASAADAAFPGDETTYLMLTDEPSGAERKTILAIRYGSTTTIKQRTIWRGAWQNEWSAIAKPEDIGALPSTWRNIFIGFWENASPGSEFPAQTVWMGLSPFRFILFEYFLEGISYPQYKFIGVGESTRIYDAHVHDTDDIILLQHRQRDITVTADAVIFGDGKYLSKQGTALLTSNDSIKPYRIYGVF